MFFLEFSCFFDDLADVGNLICGSFAFSFFSFAFSKASLNIWKFSAHIQLEPSLKDFARYRLEVNG